MTIWHSVNEIPDIHPEGPYASTEHVSRPLLIARKDGVQFVGTYTLFKRNSRKSPCWEFYTSTTSRRIIPAKDIAYWAELPDYPVDFSPKPVKWKRGDGTVMFDSNPFLENHPIGDVAKWTPKECLPPVQKRTFKWFPASPDFNTAEVSAPVLFLLDNGIQFVGTYVHRINSWNNRSYFGIIECNNPEEYRFFCSCAAMNKKRIKFWTYLPLPPEDILRSMSETNYFEPKNCKYDI